MRIRSWLSIVGLAISVTLALAGCSENAATGSPVPIPKVTIDCTTPQCRTNSASRLTVTVIFSTSGCTRSDFGATISGYSGPGSVTVSCNGSTGCYGPINRWTNGASAPGSTDGQLVTKIPSGTYSICARIDYDGSYVVGGSDAGDTVGVLDNVAVGEATANQFITSWTDL